MQTETGKPLVVTAQSLREGERRCSCCDKDLSGQMARMLEFDRMTNTYRDDRGVPPGLSQGWFPFSLDCAERLLSAAV